MCKTQHIMEPIQLQSGQTSSCHEEPKSAGKSNVEAAGKELRLRMKRPRDPLRILTISVLELCVAQRTLVLKSGRGLSGTKDLLRPWNWNPYLAPDCRNQLLPQIVRVVDTLHQRHERVDALPLDL